MSKTLRTTMKNIPIMFITNAYKITQQIIDHKMYKYI